MHVRGSQHQGLAHLLQGVRHRQTVLLEGLHRVVHAARGDEVRVAAADVQVAGQVRRAVGGTRVGRRGTGGGGRYTWVLMMLGAGYSCACCSCTLVSSGTLTAPTTGLLSRGVGVRGRAVEAVVEVEGVVPAVVSPGGARRAPRGSRAGCTPAGRAGCRRRSCRC